jgi:hypothetical protein
MLKHFIFILICYSASLAAYPNCHYLDELEVVGVAAEIVPRSPYPASIFAEVINHSDQDLLLIGVAANKMTDSPKTDPTPGSFFVTLREGGAGFVVPQSVDNFTVPADGSMAWPKNGRNIIKIYLGNPYSGGMGFKPADQVMIAPLKVTFTFQDPRGNKCKILVKNVQVGIDTIQYD